MEDRSEAHYILRIAVKHNRSKILLTIDQYAFLSSVLKRFRMEECKPVDTPLEPGAKFESAIGYLTYASIGIGTRPDISTAVGVLHQHMSKPCCRNNTTIL